MRRLASGPSGFSASTHHPSFVRLDIFASQTTGRSICRRLAVAPRSSSKPDESVIGRTSRVRTIVADSLRHRRATTLWLMSSHTTADPARDGRDAGAMFVHTGQSNRTSLAEFSDQTDYSRFASGGSSRPLALLAGSAGGPSSLSRADSAGGKSPRARAASMCRPGRLCAGFLQSLVASADAAACRLRLGSCTD
jgi:hypothetical protein